jgi:hypothetical protein
MHTPTRHSMNITRSLLLATFSMALATSQAALIWSADFSSYDTSGGAVNVTVNSTGADDTLSGTTFAGTGGTFSTEVASASSPLSGNALKLSFTNNSGNGISATRMTIFQGSQTSLDGSGVYVLSTDMVRTSSNGISEARSWSAIGPSSTAGSNNATTTAVGTTPWRFTLVINQTGANILLPGTMGALSTNTMATYFYNGTTYSGLTTTSASAADVTGFATGSYRSNSLANGQTVTVWYDNMGMWNSASDTVNGVSILSLAPGTVVPEPSACALGLLGLAASLGLVRRRARSVR